MNHSSHGQHTRTFAVPAGAGSYAPEIMYLTSDDPTTLPKGSGAFDLVSELQLRIDTIVATATVEVDILGPQGDPQTAADWRLAMQWYTTAGLKAPIAMSGWRVRVRVKSGGTAGSQVVDVAWW